MITEIYETITSIFVFKSKLCGEITSLTGNNKLLRITRIKSLGILIADLMTSRL